MGSVLESIDCPNCGTEAYSDFYYKTGEEYVMCNNCGYYHSVTLKDRNKPLNELTDDDWEIVTIDNPFGAYSIKTYQSVGVQCGTLKTEKQYNELVQTIADDVEIEWCTVSRFVDGEILTEMLIDNGPAIDSAGFTRADDFPLDEDDIDPAGGSGLHSHI